MKPNDPKYWNKLVLRKLKRLMLSGALKVEDGVRYVYEWNNAKSTEENLELVRNEDRALLHYVQAGVIEADHDDNDYRKQQLIGNEIDINWGVWGDWNDVDPAYREYEYETSVYGVYVDRFEKEVFKIGLVDTGVELADKQSDNLQGTALSEPILVVQDTGFCIHDAWRISYENKEITMQPQVRKIAALIMENSTYGRVTSAQSLIDQNMADTTYNVNDNVSRARVAFKNATRQDKNFFPNERNVGYRFIG